MQNIPLFPLYTVLYPQGILPLRIFEPRYVDMVSERMKTNSGFGVCLIKKGAETGPAATCFNIGTYADIIDFSHQADGLLTITIQGKRRFRILETSVRSNNLLEGDIDWVAETEEAEGLEEHQLLKDIYLHIVENYETLYLNESHDSIDAKILSYRLAEFLPFDKKIKQEILEIDTAGQRLELIKSNLISMEIEFDAGKSDIRLQ